MTWWCHTCCQEWNENFCATCGKMLSEEVNGGPEVPAQSEAQGRANKEGTQWATGSY